MELPSVTGFAARQAIAALHDADINVAKVLRQAGIPQSAIAMRENDSGHGRMTAAAQARLLERAADVLDDAEFGLHLAQKTDPRDAGILFYVVSGARNVLEGLMLFARYARIVNEAVHVNLIQDQDKAFLNLDFIGMQAPSARQNIEFGASMIMQALRAATGRPIFPSAVEFAHERASATREIERFFGCRVEFGRSLLEGTSQVMISFTHDTLNSSLITADSKLIDALRPFCEIARKERKTAPSALRALVETEVEKLLPHGKAQAKTIALSLGLSVRTLSRKLAEEGTTYAETVNELRQSLARQYLGEPSLSLSKIAWLLGYEGSASFNHAFKRWTGVSPSRARSEQRRLARPSQ